MEYRELGEVPELFPGFDSKDTFERQEYLQRRLVQLAQEKKLSIVHLMNQPTHIADAAGDIILGYWIDPETNTQTRGEAVPPELEDYRVKIRSIEYDKDKGDGTFVKHKRTIRYVDGHRRAGFVQRGRARGPKSEPVEVDTGKMEADLSLKAAWKVLRQGGRWCNHRISKRQQDRYWYYEEVPPSGLNGKGKG